MKKLEENENYYDFEVWREDERNSFDNPILKIAIDQNSSIEEFYLTVHHYLYPEEDDLDHNRFDQR